MKLYYSRNYHPRLSVAVARFLKVPVELEFATPLAPDQQQRFHSLNPNLRLPILTEGDKSLWEADAIACRLSQSVGSGFWRPGIELPEMIRWLSWATWNFVAACDLIHFELVTRRRYELGAVRQLYLEEGKALFAESAAILDAHLANSEWLLPSGISYADFRMACVLPFKEQAGISIEPYRNVSRWYHALDEIEAWRDPFDGLDAPQLPELHEK